MQRRIYYTNVYIIYYTNEEYIIQKAYKLGRALSDIIVFFLLQIQACRGYGYPWIYPWIYLCVDIRLQPSCGYIHGYCAVAFAN